VYHDRQARQQLLELRRVLKAKRVEDRRQWRLMLDQVKALLERTSKDATTNDLKCLYRDLFELYQRRKEDLIIPCSSDGFAYQIRQVWKLQRTC